ncbi:hypothetical protein [Kaistella carnis]|uniref:hypothetical protein n=1 Tax=Kaistella carnis TaxID=1241979 RepID=UPI00289E60E4|nr:hypothetical protein [Kaistella carnis]
MKKLILSTALILTSITAFSQKTENFNFGKYPAKIQKHKKAPLKNLSNPVTKSYAQISKDLYKSTNVNFGGHYVLLNIGSTNYETSAVLADIKTGQVYNIPENKEAFSPEAIYKCLNEQIFITKPNSNLLVLHNFDGGEFNSPKRNYYLWNDKTKKFKLLKTEKLTCKNE